MKKEARDSSLVRRMDKREQRIESKARWTLWIVIAILVILGLFYLQSYYINGDGFLTGEGLRTSSPPSKISSTPTTTPSLSTSSGGDSDDGSEGGERGPNYTEQAKSATKSIKREASKAEAEEATLSVTTDLFEADEASESIEESHAKALEELERAKEAAEKRPNEKAIEEELEEAIKAVEAIESSAGNVEEFIQAKKKEKQDIKDKVLRRIDTKVERRKDLVVTIEPIITTEALRLEEIIEEELIIEELIVGGITVIYEQGIAVASFEGDPRGSVEWTVRVEVPEGNEGQEFSIKLKHENNAENFRIDENPTGASIEYIDYSGSIITKLFDTFTGEERSTEVIFSEGTEAGEYVFSYTTLSPITSKIGETDESINIAVDSDIDGNSVAYQEVLAEVPLSQLRSDWAADSSAFKVWWIEGNQYVDHKVHDDISEEPVLQFIVPQTSEQTFTITSVASAWHLDSNKNLVTNIYSDIKELDDTWSTEIPSEEYVRVIFENPLTSIDTLELFTRTNRGIAQIEVYNAGTSNKIITSRVLESVEYNSVPLTNLPFEENAFDLRIIGADAIVQFDHIANIASCSSTTDLICTTGCESIDPDCSETEEVGFGIEEDCDDGIDNDGDGWIDEQDPDCAISQCADGIDNDGDGLIDDEDPGCQLSGGATELEGVAGAQCLDGIDNDFDGWIDFPDDPGCTAFSDNDEANADTGFQCSNGIDDDGDGQIDGNDVLGCTAWNDDDETNTGIPAAQCSNTIDDDGDGWVDYDNGARTDPGCGSLGDNDETNIDSGLECSNNRDDDLDELIDGYDTGCANWQDDDELLEEIGVPQCSNGIDDDDDGLTDSNDPGCWDGINDPESYNSLLDDESAATSECQDGIDNDSDDLIDLLDADCENDQDYFEDGTDGVPSVLDEDGDEVPDSEDNCPDVYNPDQADEDRDGIGDACDDESGDHDKDGVRDEDDNCPFDNNPDQEDKDGDGIGDACDNDDDAFADIDGIEEDPRNDLYEIAGVEGEEFREGEFAELPNLRKGDLIQFITLSGELHTVQIVEIETDRVTFTVSSDPVTKEIKIGETETFDIGEPIIIAITLDKIDGEEIDITITGLSAELLPEEGADLSPITDAIDSITGDESNKASVSSKQEGRNILIIFIIALVIVVAIAYVIFNAHNKRTERKY